MWNYCQILSDTIIKKRLWLSALLVIVLIVSAFPMSASAEPGELHVGPGYDYSTIQGAVDNATAYDTIIVHDAATDPDYEENVDVGVNYLTIREADGEDVAVMADNVSDHVFYVTADNVTIQGLDIYGATGSQKAGIYLDGTTGCEILDNRCGWNASSNNTFGIYLSGADSNTLSGNTCNYALVHGIYVVSSNSNTLSGNTCNSSSSGNGISLSYSSDNTLTNNTCNEDRTGIGLSSSTGNTVLDNTCKYNTLRGMNLSSSSDNNTVAGNIVLDNT